MPKVYVPRDASVCAAAADAPVVLVWFVVAGRAGPARGRESVAMTTPDETTARAIFARERTERKEEKGMPSARVGGSRPVGWEGEMREAKVCTICWGVYRLPMNTRPMNMDTASPARPSPH